MARKSTGFKDMNGRVILVGDIVETNVKFVVIERDEEFLLRTDKDDFPFTKKKLAIMKVIGNIYENTF